MSVREGTASAAMRLAFEPCVNWCLLPYGMSFHGDATSVAVGSDDRVYVFNRGPVPVVVIGADGTYAGGWGEGEFIRAEGLGVDSAGNLYLVDCDAHVVEKRSNDGRLLLTLGTRGQGAARLSGKPFNRPTAVAVHPRTGEIFVTDGYGNSSVHRFSPDGDHIASWGESGDDPGQFAIPHGVVVLDDDRVVVCDRENHRIQVFTTDGEFLQQWRVHRPMAVCHRDGLLYVGGVGPLSKGMQDIPNLGSKISVFETDGTLVGRFGAPLPGPGSDQFIAPHGVAVDSYGNVYVAETSRSWLTVAQEQPPPAGELVSLRKWRRVD